MRIPTYAVAVVRTCTVTPRMRRVTVGGAGLEGFASRGLPDERIKLLLSRPGQRRPVLPAIDENGYHYPVFRRLDAVREDRVIYLDLEDQLAGALGFSSALSLPFLLDEAAPRLAAAVDGDPETEVEQPR
ncbi:MAG: siderophore-interacting protein [Thermoleophilaceae bacterium]